MGMCEHRGSALLHGHHGLWSLSLGGASGSPSPASYPGLHSMCGIGGLVGGAVYTASSGCDPSGHCCLLLSCSVGQREKCYLGF